MKYLVLILLLVGSVSCQKQNIEAGFVVNDYDQYLNQFNDDLQALGYPPVDFSNTTIVKTEKYKEEFGADAYCPAVAVRSGGNIVLFVSDNMKIYSDTAKAYMMYHELGHCVLGLQHKDGNDLMSPMIGTLALWSDSFNEENRLTYLSAVLDRSGYR